MKILITGHKGFVGRYFTSKFLKDQNNEIIGLDLKSGDDCRDYFKEHDEQFDLVIHLAALVGGRQTIEGNPIAVAGDLSIDAEMFNWAVRTRPRKIIYYSSSAAYPTELQTKNFRVKLKESDINLNNIKTPDLTYGWSKLTGEMLAKHARDKYGLDVYIFRPFSGYGEDQDLDYPFPSFVSRAVKRDDPFEIWGDGNQVRDFIHIDDIVEATLKAVELEIKEPVNLCTGRATSFNELVRIMTNTVGYHPKLKHLINKPVGVMYRVGDPTNMLKFYKPKITLEEGVERAIRNGSNG